MKIPRNKRKIIWEINVTPLTDVALVLLIIFMVTAPLMFQTGLKIKLPSAVSAEKQEERKIVITVDAQGKCYFENKEIQKDNLLGLMVNYLAGSQKKVIIIDADKDTPSGVVVSVLDIARTAGADSLYISTIKGKAQ